MGKRATRPSGGAKPPRDCYSEALVAALSNSTYIKMHKAFLYNMNDGEAVMFGYLVDLHGLLTRQGRLRKTNGWFRCSVEKVQREINKTQQAQSRFLGNLKGKGLIEMKRKGRPPRRFVRINVQAVSTMIVEYNQMMEDRRDAAGFL